METNSDRKIREKNTIVSTEGPLVGKEVTIGRKWFEVLGYNKDGGVVVNLGEVQGLHGFQVGSHNKFRDKK